MSSSEEESPAPLGTKRRRVERACDNCRRRKIKCKRLDLQQTECTYCINHKLHCSFSHDARRRAPMGYVDTLEERVRQLENLMAQHCPHVNIEKEIGRSVNFDDWSRSQTTRQPSSDDPQPPRSNTLFRLEPRVEDADNEELDPSDVEDHLEGLSDRLKTLSLQSNLPRFHGKSPAVSLVYHALQVRFMVEQNPLPSHANKHKVVKQMCMRRPEFWYVQSYERTSLQPMELPVKHYSFPAPALLLDMVNLYFIYSNPILPLLHQPTFEADIEKGRHHRDIDFGAIVLIVCALGARWSADPQVYTNANQPRSAGWMWFNQVHLRRRSLLAPSHLEDLQVLCLAASFLEASNFSHSSWNIIGIGLRYAVDLGIHRRKIYSSTPTVQQEQWKRAFWALVTLERGSFHYLGRPYSINDEEIDVDLPIVCDDEHWIAPTPSRCFVQPNDKPSKAAFFPCMIQLHRIVTYAMRTIYSSNSSRTALGFKGEEWIKNTVAELDSALNKWFEGLPSHLQWNPEQPDSTFFYQAAVLNANYYLVQITIHRPFIGTARFGPLSSVSTSICANAAHMCARLLSVVYERIPHGLPSLTGPSLISGLALMLNLRCSHISGLPSASVSRDRQMDDVHMCLATLKRCEAMWTTGGRLWDILSSVAGPDRPDDQSQAPSFNAPTQVQVGRHTQPSILPPRSFIGDDYTDQRGQVGEIDIDLLFSDLDFLALDPFVGDLTGSDNLANMFTFDPTYQSLVFAENRDNNNWPPLPFNSNHLLHGI